MVTVKEKMERWKATAELFVKEDTQAYIKDLSGDLYFCDILIVGDETLTIQCFGPEQRKGQKFVLYWMLIEKFEKYQIRTEKEVKNNGDKMV